jgi:tRNA-specific 2-thiouridylase
VQVKVRSTTPAVPAIAFAAPGGARVVLAEPQYGVAPGQACVLYDGNRVLGGGWITRDEAALAA